MEMDCFAPKAVQGAMVAHAMGRQMARGGEQLFSTSVEHLLNRIHVSSKNLVHPYVNRLVRIGRYNSLIIQLCISNRTELLISLKE